MTKKAPNKQESFFTRLGKNLKNTSLFNFFKKLGKNSAHNAQEAIVDEKPAPEAAESAVQEPGEPEEAAEAAEPEVFPNELEFEPNHPLLVLWQTQAEQDADLPRPCLRLQNDPHKPEAIAQEKVEQELRRLDNVVSAAAYKRLQAVLLKNENKDADMPALNLDAEVVTFLANDQMSAWIVILPPIGEGTDVSLEALEQALAGKKIAYGLDMELLSDIPSLPNRYFHLFLVAQGAPPERGQDGYVVELFPREVKHEFSTDEYDRVDYTSLTFIRNVSKGDTICQIFPPTAGKPGRNVLNKELPAVDGQKANVPMGRNTEISEDGSELVASLTGHVEFNGRGFQVKSVLEIPGDVDYSTGNINFLGDVHIHGDVFNGFTVRAVGNITIEGVVESSTIEAGGDLIIVKGVRGNNQAIIRSHRNIYTKYLESTNVCARGDLQAECIVNCDVYCDGSVLVRTGQGIIKGGNINAAKEVSANTVGAMSEILTNVNLGGRPCENFERVMLEQELEQLEKDLEKTDRQPNSPTKHSTMSKLRMKIAVAKNKIALLDKDREKLYEETGGEQPRSRMVCGLAHPGTQITIKGVTKRLNFETHMCNARLLDGDISLM